MSVRLINMEVFGKLTKAMGPEFVIDLVTEFLGEAPDQIESLRMAAIEGNSEAYAEAASSIGSKARVFGATVLVHVARDIELAGLAEPAAYLPELETAFADTAEVLQLLVKR